MEQINYTIALNDEDFETVEAGSMAEAIEIAESNIRGCFGHKASIHSFDNEGNNICIHEITFPKNGIKTPEELAKELKDILVYTDPLDYVYDIFDCEQYNSKGVHTINGMDSEDGKTHFVCLAK